MHHSRSVQSPSNRGSYHHRIAMIVLHGASLQPPFNDGIYHHRITMIGPRTGAIRRPPADHGRQGHRGRTNSATAGQRQPTHAIHVFFQMQSAFHDSEGLGRVWGQFSRDVRHWRRPALHGGGGCRQHDPRHGAHRRAVARPRAVGDAAAAARRAPVPVRIAHPQHRPAAAAAEVCMPSANVSNFQRQKSAARSTFAGCPQRLTAPKLVKQRSAWHRQASQRGKARLCDP
eukprot:gene20937-biopygen5624